MVRGEDDFDHASGRGHRQVAVDTAEPVGTSEGDVRDARLGCAGVDVDKVVAALGAESLAVFLVRSPGTATVLQGARLGGEGLAGAIALAVRYCQQPTSVYARAASDRPARAAAHDRPARAAPDRPARAAAQGERELGRNVEQSVEGDELALHRALQPSQQVRNVALEHEIRRAGVHGGGEAFDAVRNHGRDGEQAALRDLLNRLEIDHVVGGDSQKGDGCSHLHAEGLLGIRVELRKIHVGECSHHEQRLHRERRGHGYRSGERRRGQDLVDGDGPDALDLRHVRH
eukprot:278158-Rhodomonas_salina.3